MTDNTYPPLSETAIVKIAKVPRGEKITRVVTVGGLLYVATDKRVYVLKEGRKRTRKGVLSSQQLADEITDCLYPREPTDSFITTWYDRIPCANRFTINIFDGRLIQDKDGPWVLRVGAARKCPATGSTAGLRSYSLGGSGAASSPSRTN